MYKLIDDILICPNCGADKTSALDIQREVCTGCQRQFFRLNDVPVWCPAGMGQKDFWCHLLAKFTEEIQIAYEQSSHESGSINNSLSTRKRVQDFNLLRFSCHKAIVKVLTEAGLEAKKNPLYDAYDTKGFTQYYGLLLRDWAWKAEGEKQAQKKEQGKEGYRPYVDENDMALNNVLSLIPEDIDFSDKKILVIGAGAGRLSWNLHCRLKPKVTVSFDSNPVLTLVSKDMVKDKKTMELFEARLFPHQGLPVNKTWTLSCPKGNEDLRGSWLPFCGDAWAMPFAFDSFDLVITPWFLDVCGKDAKELIALIDCMVKPGGSWLNYGPFLYSGLSESVQYTPQEVRDFLAMCEFSFKNEEFFVTPYTYSPLSQRGRIEEVWGFFAQAAQDKQHLLNGGETDHKVNSQNPPAWLVLPHLPIPKFVQENIFPQGVEAIAQLIDGTHSINDIADKIESAIPKETDPIEFVYEFLNATVIETPSVT